MAPVALLFCITHDAQTTRHPESCTLLPVLLLPEEESFGRDPSSHGLAGILRVVSDSCFWARFGVSGHLTDTSGEDTCFFLKIENSED